MKSLLKPQSNRALPTTTHHHPTSASRRSSALAVMIALLFDKNGMFP